MNMIGWKCGFEIELLAPAGLTRADLAAAYAARIGSQSRRLFHPQAEPRIGGGAAVFETLTLGYAVPATEQGVGAKFVDDLTIRSDLDRNAAAVPGWYRLAVDDIRLARLLELHCDPADGLEDVLVPAIPIFGGSTDTNEAGMVRLGDSAGATIAIAAPLRGGRERPCEIITAPIETDHLANLERLLAPARELSFLLPAESAVHVHFDGAPLCDARILQNMVRLFETHRETLREICQTNPNCRRLGPYAQSVLDVVFADDFATLDWPEARERLLGSGLTKYCDFNLVNLVAGHTNKHTLEVRILGPDLDAASIVERAALFERILRFAMSRRNPDEFRLQQGFANRSRSAVNHA